MRLHQLTNIISGNAKYFPINFNKLMYNCYFCSSVTVETVEIVSFTPSSVKNILPNDEIVQAHLFSKAKNGFYCIKMSQFVEVKNHLI